MMGQAIKERGGHLRITGHVGPFSKRQVGGDDYADALVEFREEMEQKRPTGPAEGQIPQLIEDHQERQVQKVLQLQQRMNTTMDA